MIAANWLEGRVRVRVREGRRNTEDKHKRDRKYGTNRRMRINMMMIEGGMKETAADSAADKEVSNRGNGSRSY